MWFKMAMERSGSKNFTLAKATKRNQTKPPAFFEH